MNQRIEGRGSGVTALGPPPSPHVVSASVAVAAVTLLRTQQEA